MNTKMPHTPGESWDAHYKVPIVHHASLDSLQLRKHEVAVHEVTLSPELSIDFYAKLKPSEVLYVSLHGAVPLAAPRYPHFRRVESMKDRVDSVLCIADPTLHLHHDDAFRLGWYAGGETWDPAPALADVVQQAMQSIGARRVMFLGGSGGGFASLQLATLFPGSMAFVQDPQTDVGAYYAGHRDRLFASTWPSWEQTDALSQHPSRFNMLHHYSTATPENFIYYRQSTSDDWHVRNHAKPFERAISDTPGAKSGRYRFVYEEGEKPGHGKISPAEFDQHLTAAMDFWNS